MTDEQAFALGKHVLALCGVTLPRRQGVTEIGRQVAKAVDAIGMETQRAETPSGSVAKP